MYYAINSHLYHVSNKDDAKSLIESSKDIKSVVKSKCIKEDELKNIYADKTIYENVSVDELKTLDNCIAIYSKNDLNEEFDLTVSQYNYFPKIKNQKYDIVRIDFNLDNKNVILCVDPNDLKTMNFKTVQELCLKAKTEFKNQSFSQFVRDLKETYLSAKSQRVTFTETERTQISETFNGKCNNCKCKLKDFHIDHIVPLANGGSNDVDN